MNAKHFKIFFTTGILVSSIPVSGAIIAGWDSFVDVGSDTYNASVVNGVSAQAVGTSTNDGAGWGPWPGKVEGRSADGTWGTISGDVAPSTSTANNSDSVGLRNAESEGTLTITLTNTSGSSLELTSFNFDAITRFTDGPDTWALSTGSGSDVTVQSDIAGGSVFNTGAMANRTGSEGNYDINLSGLTDTIFEDGEQVIFELAFTGGDVSSTSGGHNMMMDNLAVTAVAEPSTIALISGLAMFGFILYRRYRKG
jgi:hypothetical protein